MDQRLNAALLAYRRSPGRYQVTRREPAILFASVRNILQLAAGRPSSGGAGSGVAPSSELQDAARFFARTALFYAGADHYSLFGLPRGVPAPELKDRYRLLMRLIHPDYASASAWPPDTAVRVNRAYQVLSSPVLRREYDNTLAQVQAGAATTGSNPLTRQRPSCLVSDEVGNERARKRMFAAGIAGIGGVVLIVAGFTLGSRSEPVSLVQRAQPPQGQAAPVQIVQAPAPQQAPASTAQSGAAPRTRAAAPMPADIPAPIGASAAHADSRSGPSLSEVQPLLAKLLQQMESRRGDSLLTLLDADARNRPAARALALHYDALMQDASQVRLAHVEYRADPSEGGLLVTGRVRLLLDEHSPMARGLRMTLRAEFATRGREVVLIALSGGAN